MSEVANGLVDELSTEKLESRTGDAGAPADELKALRRQLAEAQARVHEFEQFSDDRANEVIQLEARLAEITHSSGWKLVEVLRRIRRTISPAGSQRDRFGRWCAHRLRRARYHAQRVIEGARGSWVRRSRRRGCRPAHGQADVGRQFPRVQPPIDPGVGTEGLVSVILPVYNQAELLPAAIESVLNQTYADVELIVVNDGSSDDIEGVLGRYVDHPQVRVLTQINQKLPKALSNGFEFATGQFRSWTSADNLMKPAQLARQIDFLTRQPEVALVYANYVAIDDRGQPLRDPSFRRQNRPRPDSPEIHLPHDPEPLNRVEDNFVGACFLYREWAGWLIGEYSPRMGLEDYDYWMRMNTLTKIAHLDSDECLYCYRVHDNTISARADELRIYQGVRQLMWHERERRAAYFRPWTVVADDATRQWLSRVDATGDAMLSLGEMPSGEEAPDKTLVLIHADSLPQVDRESLPAGCCVAVWFDAEHVAAYRYRRELRDVADVCFAPERETAERVALFHRSVFVAPPGQGLYDLAIAFGNNHVFYNATVAAEKRVRRLPEPFEVAGRCRRILLQVDDFLQGGFEQVVLDVAATLTQAGMDPQVLVLGRRGHAVGRARELGLRVLSLPEKDREQRYRDLLSEQKIDLVNAHFSLFGAQIAREVGIPFVQTIHTSYVFLSPEKIAAFRAADGFTSAYICTSGNTALYADARLGLDVGKTVIVPNGIELERLELGDRAAARARVREELGLSADDFVFLNVGSIYRDKAQKMIVTALAEVREEHPRARLVLLGKSMENAYVEEIRREITRVGLADAVIFADFTEQVAAYYAMADAFVLPSFWEGWSLALAEALCMGLPIVATDVGAARDLLPTTGTHLVPPVFDTIADVHAGNIDQYVRREHPSLVSALTVAMRQVCADPVAPALSDAARQSIDRRNAYRAYTRLFRWVMQGGAPAAARAWSWADQR